ncbi:MAG: RidA family protein [Myxococcota bacterium]|jgi:2-iminobutanoate/2-iminopropanoate deaminase|nr:RidA family protein [Myxococcota bacterium]HOS60987.1 RidA family protein [Myxococcota bacterium]HPC91164.1 RidA family protein [Myxococcota bacterium]HPL24131.1 RidA family protein [Myxococcota bacterium]HQC45112.1 RidA family protein [Myxococcota bacterium]
MNSNHPVESPNAPKAIGPYSQAIECSPGRLLFLSGQIGINPVTGTMVTGGIEAETAQVLANLEAVLIAGGMAKWNVVKTTILLTDMADFGTVNQMYGEFFGEHRPARATFQVSALPKGALVEIEAIAAI